MTNVSLNEITNVTATNVLDDFINSNTLSQRRYHNPQDAYFNLYINTKPFVLSAIGAKHVGNALAQVARTAEIEKWVSTTYNTVPIVAQAALTSGVPAAFLRRTSMDAGAQHTLDGAPIVPGDKVCLVQNVSKDPNATLRAVLELESMLPGDTKVTQVVTIVEMGDVTRTYVSSINKGYWSMFTVDHNLYDPAVPDDDATLLTVTYNPPVGSQQEPQQRNLTRGFLNSLQDYS